MSRIKTFNRLKSFNGEQCFDIAPKYGIQMDVVSPLALIEFLKTFLVKE